MSEKINKDSISKIVLAGILGALSIVLFLTPLGYIPWISGASLTIMHIPTIIAAILGGPYVGSITGLIFGLSSLIKAATSPQGPIDMAFVNPLISVLPRLIMGFLTGLVYIVFIKRLKTFSIIFSAILGSIINSILVLCLLVIFKYLSFKVAVLVFIFNSLIEALLAAILCLAVVKIWQGLSDRSGKAKILKNKN